MASQDCKKALSFASECRFNGATHGVTRMGKRRFKIVLIVPSHYDDDGYVIQWLRSIIPSTSLASVYGLLAECADAQVLGPEVDIEVDPYDEMNSVINV